MPLSPSFTFGAKSLNSDKPSSSVIVASVLACLIDALVGLLNIISTVSSGSSVVSPVTGTEMVLLVSPAAKVSVPVTGVKSTHCVAVPAVVLA